MYSTRQLNDTFVRHKSSDFSTKSINSLAAQLWRKFPANCNRNPRARATEMRTGETGEKGGGASAQRTSLARNNNDDDDARRIKTVSKWPSQVSRMMWCGLRNLRCGLRAVHTTSLPPFQIRLAIYECVCVLYVCICCCHI